MLPPLLLRADGSPAIGLGHAMRLLALGQAYADAGGRVHLVFADLPETLRKRFVVEGITLHHIGGQPGSLDDARATAYLARALNISWVAVDGYRFTAEYRRTVKEAGVSVLVMDDLALETYDDADIVVNQNVNAETLRYRAGSATRLLLGSRYVLLRREFLALKRARGSVAPVVRHVLVTFGGSDPNNTTGLVLTALDAMRLPTTTIDVVIGGANPHRKQLETLAAGANNRIRLLHDVNDMPRLMARADVALSAAGTTALELAFAGVPSILCATADNQTAALHAFRTRRTALTIGMARSLTVDAVQAAVAQLINDLDLRRTLASRAQALVDGCGARRVLRAMFPLKALSEGQENRSTT